jgi:hypothetical protein
MIAVDNLQECHHDAFEAHVLQLEILSNENISDCDEYAESKKTTISCMCPTLIQSFSPSTRHCCFEAKRR